MRSVVGAVVYHSYGACRLFMAHRSPRISEKAEEKRKEENIFVRSGKSEAEVTNNKRLRQTYCRPTTEADRHEALRDLSVTAELFVHFKITYYIAPSISVKCLRSDLVLWTYC